MSLFNESQACISRYTQDLHQLRMLLIDINTLVLNRKPQEMVSIPDRNLYELAKYSKEFMDFTIQVASEMRPLPQTDKQWVFQPSGSYSKETQKQLWPFLLAVFRFVTYPSLLYNMALTHTITITEAFLKDFLITIFKRRPDTLKSEQTETYEAILSYSSKKQLINHLAEEAAEKILRDNIDDITVNLNKRFSINLSRFSDFDVLREAFSRRNIIVHNNSTTDKQYCNKILGSKVGAMLETDWKYMEEVFKAVGGLVDYLDSCFSRKMRYKRNPLLNHLLNPPETILKTP